MFDIKVSTLFQIMRFVLMNFLFILMILGSRVLIQHSGVFHFIGLVTLVTSGSLYVVYLSDTYDLWRSRSDHKDPRIVR